MTYTGYVCLSPTLRLMCVWGMCVRTPVLAFCFSEVIPCSDDEGLFRLFYLYTQYTEVPQVSW